MTPCIRHLPHVALLAAALAATAPAWSQAPAPMPPVPAVDAAAALEGRALVEALRRGGYVLFLRHAEQGNLRPPDDCSKPALTPEGVDQAKRLGEALRHAGIPVDPPVTSPICRALETARLLGFGTPATNPLLIPEADATLAEQREKLVSTPPPVGRNTVLVSHVISAPPDKRYLSEKAGFVVLKPDGAGGRAVVAHVAPATWAEWLKEPPAAK